MPSVDAFELLGLDQKTASLRDVKKAYSICLKKTRPDEDPEGFMQLREAFTFAKRVAQDNDTRAEENVDAVEDLALSTPEVQSLELTYWYDEKLCYNFDSSPIGKLIERTVQWIKTDGTQPNQFFSQMALDIQSTIDVTPANYRNWLTEYIFFDATGEDPYSGSEVWSELEFSCPKWLKDDVIIAIGKEINLFQTRPQTSWSAQHFNLVLKVFEPTLSAHKGSIPLPEPANTVALFANEQDKQRGDAHGSFFDSAQKKWIDKSPVALAMTDLEALAAAPDEVSDPVEPWRQVLERDELQSLDEYQALDQRLRSFICQETGQYADQYAGKKGSENTPWMTQPILRLLDDHFGWSAQYGGRQAWERSQYEWLHEILANYGIIKQPVRQFRQEFQAPKPKMGLLLKLLVWLSNPIHLLGSYFTFRGFITLWRFL